MAIAGDRVPPDRQHEIRNEIAGLLCEFFGLPDELGPASIFANVAIENMNNHAWEMWLSDEIDKTAKAAREAGQSVQVNSSLPYVLVIRGEDDEFYFQGEEASNLLDECPDFVSQKDWLLWMAQGW